MKLGTLSLAAILLGTTAIGKVYLGNTQIYSAATQYVTRTTQVAITIPTSATSATLTIPACDPTKSFLIFQHQIVTGATGVNNIRRARIELTNATTITALRNTSSPTAAITVYATLIECSSDLVSSVQQGTVTLGAVTSATATITAVDVTRSTVIWLGATTTNAANNGNVGSSGVTLTNSTTVTANYNTSPTSAVVGFVVVEFQAAALVSRQQFASSFSDASTTNAQTISSVNTSNSLIFYGGFYGAGSIHAESMCGINLTSTTNVDLVRGSATASSRTTNFTVIEFIPAVFASAVQRGSISLTSATSNTATISAIGSKGAGFYLGGNTTYTSTSALLLMTGTELTNSTTVTARRGASDASTVNAFYQIADFA